MEDKETQRLLQLYDEVDTDEYEQSDGGENSSYCESSDSDRTNPLEANSNPGTSQKNSINDCDNGSASEGDKSSSSPVPQPGTSGTQQDRTDSESSSSEEWTDYLKDIPDFNFDNSFSGVKLEFNHLPSPLEVFSCLWTDEIIDMFVAQTNAYGTALSNTNKPHRKYTRISKFEPTDANELKKFLGLCLLQGQVRFPIMRYLFSYDPLYYHPIFSHVFSGRRFEQLLRCFNCTNARESTDRLNKVSKLLKMLIENYQNAYSPEEALSLDESLLLHRGRLSFRQYIKGKKAKYGIKFYELCSTNGYTQNIEIYKGKQPQDDPTTTKLHSLVLRLMKPFLNKGHHIVMDNYYNSVSLSKKLLRLKTHSTGTLRSNRKGNPKEVTSKKLKKGDHIWKRCGKVYVSKWKDKRDVLCITTRFQPRMVEVRNSYGKVQMKPLEVSKYNENMSGVDRSDQLTSYYSCPRKSIRWYKKVIFHLLDVTVINSFLIHQEIYSKANKKCICLLSFRESLIKALLGIPADLKDGRMLVRTGLLHGGRRDSTASSAVPSPTPTRTTLEHVLEKIPLPENYSRKSYFLRCRQCSKEGKRSQTSWRCKGCSIKPPLCQGECFENYHVIAQ